MSYFIMFVSIFLSVVNACILRQYGAVDKKGFNVYLFNTGVSVVWILIMSTLFFASGNTLNPEALFYGGIYGIILFTFLLFKTQSMANGPVSLTTLIGSCAFVIATAFGVICCGESVNAMQLIGMTLLLVSLFFCVNPKKSTEKLTKKWIKYCLGFFLAGGFVGILYKLFGKSQASGERETMLLTAAIVSTLLFFIFGLTEAKRNGVKVKPPKAVIPFMLLSGIVSCAYIRLNLSLSAVIPSVIFFPVSNGGMVILSTIAGRVLFKEKLTTMQYIGIALGCIAVVVIGSGDAILSLLV